MYSISSATEQKITDLAGNTVSAVMDDAAAATMTVETPFTSETYMYGEQAVAVYLAKDDYYFPEDYQATVTGGSGTLDITRVNAKEIFRFHCLQQMHGEHRMLLLGLTVG